MRIRARFFASLREATGLSALELEAPEGLRVGDLLARLQIEHPRLGPALEQSRVAVNYEYVGPDFRLHEGDEVALIPPVSGGAVRPEAGSG